MGGQTKSERRERYKGEKKGFPLLSKIYGAIGKVDPRIESYAWVPKSWSLVKLYEVENFLTLNIFSLKAM